MNLPNKFTALLKAEFGGTRGGLVYAHVIGDKVEVDFKYNDLTERQEWSEATLEDVQCWLTQCWIQMVPDKFIYTNTKGTGEITYLAERQSDDTFVVKGLAGRSGLRNCRIYYTMENVRDFIYGQKAWSIVEALDVVPEPVLHVNDDDALTVTAGDLDFYGEYDDIGNPPDEEPPSEVFTMYIRSEHGVFVAGSMQDSYKVLSLLKQLDKMYDKLAEFRP